MDSDSTSKMCASVVIHSAGIFIGWLWSVALDPPQSLLEIRGLEDSTPATHIRPDKFPGISTHCARSLSGWASPQ